MAGALGRDAGVERGVVTSGDHAGLAVGGWVVVTGGDHATGGSRLGGIGREGSLGGEIVSTFPASDPLKNDASRACMSSRLGSSASKGTGMARGARLLPSSTCRTPESTRL